MLCGVCWRAPWPTQPAATGHMALWRLAYPLAAWHCGLLAGGRPFPVAGVVSLSQCGGVGIRGGHLPGVQAGPIRQYILGSGHLLRSERGELRSFPRKWELAVLEKPWRPQRDIIRTNSGRETGMGGDRASQEPVQNSTTVGPSVLPWLRGCYPPPLTSTLHLYEAAL